LNLTKKKVSKSIAKSVKKSGGRGKYPKTKEMLGGIKEGIKVAAFGPFTPIANVAGELLGGLLKKRSVDRSGSSTYGGQSSDSIRGGSGISGGIDPRERFRHEADNGLFKFFNDKAYKAKWTRELIDRMKGLTRPGSKSGLRSMSLPGVGVVSSLFSKGIVGGFKAAGVAGAFTFAGYEVYKAFNAWKKKEDAADQLISASSGLKKITLKMEARAAANAPGTTSPEYIKEMAANKRTHQESIRQVATMKEPLSSIGPLKHIPIVAGINLIAKKLAGYKRPEVQPISDIVKDYENRFGPKIPQSGGGGSGGSSSASDKPSWLDGFNKNFEEFNVRIGSINQPFQQVKLSPSGNQYDAADPLINALSSGRLTVDER